MIAVVDSHVQAGIEIGAAAAAGLRRAFEQDDFGAVLRQPHQQDAGPFEGGGHLKSSCVEGPQAQALQECRDACLRLGAVACEERVQGLVLSKDVAEDRVQRLDDVCVGGGGSGNLLGR